MSTRKAVSIGIVVLLHVALGYAFITGLAFTVIKKIRPETTVVDVKEAPPPPPKEPPPPPPKQEVTPPPIVAPPPIVRTPTLTPPIVAPPPPPIPLPPAPPTITAPPAPAPPTISKAAGAKGDPSQWITDADYPPGAQRDQKEGVSKIAWDINEQGRVENCHTVASSGTPELDDAACRLVTRRGRYSPALSASGAPIRSSSSRSVRWRLPQD